MVELGPLGPVDPATGRHPNTPATELINYWSRGPGSQPLATEPIRRTYTYTQAYRYPWDIPGLTEPRKRRYIVRVTQDVHGRVHSRTERYDPERGSGPDLRRVELPELSKAISVPMAIFVVALIVPLCFLPLPLAIVMCALWSLLGWTRLYNEVQRAAFAKHLRRLPPGPPPLMTPEELDDVVFKLANPDEDRTFDEPAPIPVSKYLRDREWLRWEDRLPDLPDHEYQVGRRTYEIKQRNGFADGPDHPLYRLIQDARFGVGFRERYRSTRLDGAVEDDETLRPLFEAIGREVLGPVATRELEDRRRAAAHGEPMLDRRFAARTDCADGHVGEHPILSTFIDSNGNKRIRRGCQWCPSIWSEIA